MNQIPVAWLVAVLATAILAHAIITVAMIMELRRLAGGVNSSSERSRGVAEICEQSLHRASDCIVGVNRIDDSLGSLANDVNDNVFRLMWQEEPQRGRKVRQ